MTAIQTIGTLSTLQAYGIAGIVFLLVPLVLAGAASAFMHKGPGKRFNWL